MMTSRFPRSAIMVVLLVGPVIAVGQEAEPARSPIAAAELFERVRPSVVVVSVSGRTGGIHGMGTGFIVSKDGLVVTNKHVIGEGRDINVELADGHTVGVQSVYATAKNTDLAVLKIDARDLAPLEVGLSADLVPGTPVIAVGNPHGLAHSVVAGVVSAKREIDGMPMLQLALPVEPGNSGGPVIDREGRVVGIVTMKSAVTNNLGFAIESDAIRPLLDHPNPIPIDKWRTIGALDRQKWEIVFGADWNQRAGRIHVSEPGAGFGGRSLCLSSQSPPALPYELSVDVLLDDESGAAGIAFSADGGDRHYGFYPSAGQLRLTRFDGPDIFSWTILEQVSNPHYVPGEWNNLRVRLTPDSIECFVNGDLAIESRDVSFREGRGGLAKFRDTEATFRHFAIGSSLEHEHAGGDVDNSLNDALARLQASTSNDADAVATLLAHPREGVARLRQRARQLEISAKRLETLATKIHEQSTVAAMLEMSNEPSEKIDLLRGALLIARLDNDELDPDAYVAEVDRMVAEIQATLEPNASETARLDAIDRYLFEEQGYHGSRGDYYHRSNSYMNEVIDDREGLPITLSILYMELARRLDVPMSGVGLPGHFIVRHEPKEGESELIDVFDRGRRMTVDEAKTRVAEATGIDVEPDDYVVDNKAILIRVLGNLAGLARAERDMAGMLRYVDAKLAWTDESAIDHWQRGILRMETGDVDGAAADARWLMERQPSDIDMEAVHRLLQMATKENP